MPSAADLTPEKRFFGLFIGASGTGKTVAAASFPASSPDSAAKGIYFLDFDGRIRGLLGAPWINRADITYDVFPPKSSDTITKLSQKFEIWMQYAKLGSAGSNLPHTLVLDSATWFAFSALIQAISLTHVHKSQTPDKKQIGKFIGTIPMPGPEDYGYEAQVVYDAFSALRTLPIPNVIVTAHIVDRYGKADPNNPYSDTVVVGEKLALRDKLQAILPSLFDHVFRFDKIPTNDNKYRYIVKTNGDLARSAYRLPLEIDFTEKSFYAEMMRSITP